MAEVVDWRAVNWTTSPGILGNPWRFSGVTTLAGGSKALWELFVNVGTPAEIEQARQQLLSALEGV